MLELKKEKNTSFEFFDKSKMLQWICRFASGRKCLSQKKLYNHLSGITEISYENKEFCGKYMIEDTLTVLSDSFGKVEDTKTVVGPLK